MNRITTDLSSYNNSWYRPGNFLKRICWYITNLVFFKSGFPVNSIKVFLLRLYGARIGKGVVIKPFVNIKYPWKLEVGNYAWLGESVWIDNLALIRIGDHCCISQGAMLLCGNHNYNKTTFDLIVREIHLENGAWVGAKAVVCPGVKCGSHSVLSVGSVAIKNLEPYWIYQGNPAVKIKERSITS
jgi:putative colanic acid biosynthesis acetyltransferase WcaF